jgi:tungstate transport system substrate-binding protein
MDRRDFLIASAGAAAITACRSSGGGGDAKPPADPALVRVASVPTCVEGHVLPELIKTFEAHSAYKIQLATATNLFEKARAGEVDLAISHYGHKQAEDFVVEGLGEWPRTVFANQVVLVGPASDPANVRGLDDAGEAFKRIATTKSTFILNELEGLKYLVEVMWHLAGQPDRAGWLRGHQQEDALLETAKAGGYTMWGLTPFLRLKKKNALALEPLVVRDPLFNRLMVSIQIKPRLGAINVAGAAAFEQFLLEPATQAAMRSIDYDETKVAHWMPAGYHNRIPALPKSTF